MRVPSYDQSVVEDFAGPVLTRVLLADDHALVRVGIKEVIENMPGWAVCGEAENGREAVEMVAKLKPYIIIMDLSMPEMDGLNAITKIRLAHPESVILVLSMHESEAFVHSVLRAGARGYLLKSDSGKALVTCLEALKERRTYFSPKVADLVLHEIMDGPKTPASQNAPLSARQREVLHLLAEGKSNKEVAADLGISIKTAESHRAQIMAKLKARSVTDLVRYAIRNKIADL
jgi:DNA-binding NarL/FixJ family response regulator